MQGVDLHTHSNISDGTLSPAALVESAVAHGIHTLALTDHDTMDGLVLAQQAAESHPLQIISGVEISSQWARPATKRSYAVHIVALNMQQPEPLHEALIKQKEIRAVRAEQICTLLQPLIGRQIYEDVLALADFQPDRITRTHIAKVLVQQKIVSRAQQAFDRFLKEGKKAFVPFEGLSLAETVAVIQQSRGFAVLAHPTRYDLSATNVRYLIELFAQAGGHAVELPPSIDPLSTRQMIDRMIMQHQLKVSVGSDFHGENMPWIKLGQIPKVNPDQSGIWQAFH